MTHLSRQLQERFERLQDGLKNAGVRLTHQRLEILFEIINSKDHPDVETLYKRVSKRIPTVSIDTVYRTLWLLFDLGLITTLGLLRDRVRFEAGMTPHHHFVCTQCGLTQDVYSEKLDHLPIPDIVKTIGTMEKAQVEIKGLCFNCLKKGKPNQGAVRKKGRVL
jgi:Fur family peroxide stress response transcriptional regulator